MIDGCPHLDYRETANGMEFAVRRAYCTVAERFVRPVKADICTERYGLTPADHCEIYRAHEGLDDQWLAGDATGYRSGEDSESQRPESPNGGVPEETESPDDTQSP